jgi:hypothetical protein
MDIFSSDLESDVQNLSGEFEFEIGYETIEAVIDFTKEVEGKVSTPEQMRVSDRSGTGQRSDDDLNALLSVYENLLTRDVSGVLDGSGNNR